jgi:hypothetical protein
MDSILFFIIGGLFVVIIVEFFFMQWMVDVVSKEKKQLLEELSRATKAVISKNANEYVMTAAIDKVPKEETPKVESDFVDPESLSDDQFDTVLGIKRQAPK